MHGSQREMHLKGYIPLVKYPKMNIRTSNSIFIKYIDFLSQLFE